MLLLLLFVQGDPFVGSVAQPDRGDDCGQRVTFVSLECPPTSLCIYSMSLSFCQRSEACQCPRVDSDSVPSR